MPYMDWHVLISVFGYKLIKCNECGSIHLQHGQKTVRIHGRSCLRHTYRHIHTFK